MQEVRNAIRAYERFPRWNPARETDLLHAHEILMAGLLDAPGHYRRGGVRVVGGGRVHHVGPPAARVPGLMADLLELTRPESPTTKNQKYRLTPRGRAKLDQLRSSDE